MIRVTKLSRDQIAEFAKNPQQIKYFEALQTNVSELPEAIAILTVAVAEAQADADIATTSANEALTLANQNAPDDFLPEMIVQPIGGGDEISGATAGAATKATPIDTDLIPLIDSAAGYTLKNLTWANLKATLKTYFDSVVTTLTNKTIALGSNAISGTLAQFNAAVTDADFASLAGVETLTNKTLTTPAISGGTIDNATIGATTAGTGRFTTVTTTTAGSTVVVESFIAPTLINSWVNYGAGFNNAGYYKDAFGIVHLRGFIKDGTAGAVMFILPSGYRPANSEVFATAANGLFAVLVIDNAGNVTHNAGSTVWFTLDGITFKAV